MKKIIWITFTIVAVVFVGLFLIGMFIEKKQITNEDIEKAIYGGSKSTYEKIQEESMKAEQKYKEYSESQTPSNTTNSTKVNNTASVATKDWLTHTSSTYGFSIKYPKDYKLVDNSIYAAPVYFMTPETTSKTSYVSVNVHEEKAYCRLAFYTGTEDKVVGMNKFRFMDLSPIKTQAYFLLKGEKCYQIEIQYGGLTKEAIEKVATNFVSTFKLI